MKQELLALAEVLRSRGRNNTLYDINRAADALIQFAATPAQAAGREEIAQKLLDRFLERGHARLGGPTFPIGTKLSALPHSYLDDFLKDADAILSLGGAGEEWLPIETAPLNEKILGYWDGPGDMLPGLIGKTKTGGIEWAPAEFISGKNWIMPTHWRPLPKPPSGDMKSDGEQENRK